MRRRIALALPVPVLAGAVLTVLVVDLVERTVELSTAALAGIDWTAHLATTLLLLAAFQPVLRRPVFLAAMAASVLIDLDHLPQYLGSRELTHGTFRPYPHSATTVLLLLTVAVAGRPARPVALGAAIGVGAHIWRDLSAGGVPLLWPVSNATVSIPYPVHLAAFALILILAERRGRRLRGDYAAPT